MAALKRALAEVGGPPDAKTKLDLRGQVIPLNQLLDGFRNGLIIAVVVIFLLLAANFQSLRLSLVVVSTVPAAIAGVVVALWITRHHAQHPVRDGRDHGHRRGRGQRHPARDLCRA